MRALVYIGSCVPVLMSLIEGQARLLRRESNDGSCQQVILRK